MPKILTERQGNDMALVSYGNVNLIPIHLRLQGDRGILFPHSETVSQY